MAGTDTPRSSEPGAAPGVLLRDVPAAVVGERDLVAVTGSDAVQFLQGQLSADVAAVEPGGSTWSLLLQPQGKVDAWVRVWRPAGRPEEVLLDVDPGYGPAVAARLRRFLLRVDVELAEMAWSWVALRGRGVASLDVGDTKAELVAGVTWGTVEGLDLLGPSACPPAGVPLAEPAALEVLRIEAGWPAMGRELDADVIPAELGSWLVESSASFTKGCYTGQELVARIDSRGGNTPRRLRGLLIGEGSPPPGAEVVVDGQDRGRLTSVAARDGGGTMALALVHRSVEPPATATVRWAGGDATATVVELPIAGGGAGAPG